MMGRGFGGVHGGVSNPRQSTIDNHGSGYLGMAKGFNVTRQISDRLSKILPQLQCDIAENKLHHLLL